MVRRLKDLPGIQVATKTWTEASRSLLVSTGEVIPAGKTIWLKMFVIPLRVGMAIPRQRGKTLLAERTMATQKTLQEKIARGSTPIYLPLEMETLTWEGRNGWTPLMVSVYGGERTRPLEDLMKAGNEMMSSTQAPSLQAHGS